MSLGFREAWLRMGKAMHPSPMSPTFKFIPHGREWGSLQEAGRLARSEVFKEYFRPASQILEMLRAGAARVRAATQAIYTPSGNPLIDQGIEEIVFNKISDDIIEVLISASKIPSDISLIGRFWII